MNKLIVLVCFLVTGNASASDCIQKARAEVIREIKEGDYDISLEHRKSGNFLISDLKASTIYRSLSKTTRVLFSYTVADFTNAKKPSIANMVGYAYYDQDCNLIDTTADELELVE